jgi:hypothetical protein
MMYQKIARKGGKVDKACDVYISRAHMGSGWNLAKSKWAMPPEVTLSNYRDHLESTGLVQNVYELCHQTLGCWCKNSALCHASILIELTQKYLAQSLPVIVSENKNEVQAYLLPTMIIDRVPWLKVRHKKEVKAESQKKEVKAEFQKTATSSIAFKNEAAPPLFAPTTSLSSAADPENDEQDLNSLIDPFSWIKSPIVLTQHWDKPPFNCPATTIEAPPDVLQTLPNGHVVIYKPLRPIQVTALDVTTFVKCLKKPPAVTKGFHTKLLQTPSLSALSWQPFVCYVAKITRSKKNNRYLMILSEQTAAEAKNENSIKVHLAAQLSCLFQNRLVQKDDLIEVQDYAVSQIGVRKNVVIVCGLRKIQCS